MQAQAETSGRSLFASQVNDASISNTQYVTNLYEAFLQRGPDAGGLGFWSDQASVGQGRQNVLGAFATCGAFRELAGTLYREANWLIADQLGTPRMVVNKSGSFGSVKRHDYLPFGEELYAGTGGRTTAQGYSGDSVRQKFTRKERDNETELDFFEARYFASIQGRFTSFDPENAGAEPTQPQSWNGYAYVLDNPTNSVDPTGLRAVNFDWRWVPGDPHSDSDGHWEKEIHYQGLRGYKKVPSKDGSVVDYVWVNDPKVHDVPNNFRYVDTMGRAIQLFGNDDTNAHAWGGISQDGAASPDNTTQAPGSYTGYLDTERTLKNAGYEEFFDIHPAHLKWDETGDNYAKPQSPTLHVTIFRCAGCSINGEPTKATELTDVQIHSDAHSPVNNKLKHLRHDVLPPLVPRPRSWGGVIGPRRH